MFGRKKPESIKIDLGRIKHNAPTIYEALGIEKKIFDECIKKAAKNSELDLAHKHQITWTDLLTFQGKIFTERVSKLWGIKKRKYEISLEAFVETILVYRNLVTDCIPCGEGEAFKAGMLSAKNEIGACLALNCPAHTSRGHHEF